MKKIVLLFAAAALATGAFAQGNRIEWGVKSGLNLATLTHSDMSYETVSINSKLKPSFHVGVFVDIPLGTYISFQPELLYSRQGTFYKETVLSKDYKIWTRFDYINIPLMFKFYVFEKLSVDVGPQFGFVIDATQKRKGSDGDGTEDIDSDGYKSFDASFGMGLTYKVCRNIDVFARYNLGLTEVGKISATTSDKMKNSVIQVGAGYRF